MTDSTSATTDGWEEFREGDGEPIRVGELTRLDLGDMPEDIHLAVFDDYFPDTTLWRSGDRLVCEIQEHLYTKYWEHKFSSVRFRRSDGTRRPTAHT